MTLAFLRAAQRHQYRGPMSHQSHAYPRRTVRKAPFHATCRCPPRPAPPGSCWRVRALRRGERLPRLLQDRTRRCPQTPQRSGCSPMVLVSLHLSLPSPACVSMIPALAGATIWPALEVDILAETFESGNCRLRPCSCKLVLQRFPYYGHAPKERYAGVARPALAPERKVCLHP